MDGDDDPTLDYGRPRAAYQSRPPLTRRAKLGWTLVGAIGAVVAFGLLVVVLPLGSPSRPTNNLSRCASNLHQIGLSILLYQQDFGGNYPDTFDDLIRTVQTTPEMFVSPSTDDTPAVPPTTGPTRLTAGHCSYIYVGRGLTVKTVLPTTVVAYEPLSNHNRFGCHVLLGDGHVDFFDAKQAASLPATSPAAAGPTTR